MKQSTFKLQRSFVQLQYLPKNEKSRVGPGGSPFGHEAGTHPELDISLLRGAT